MSNIKWDEKTLYLIPPAGMTREQLLFWRIKHDKKWYIEKFLKIRDKTANLVEFKFNPAQMYIYRKYLECILNDQMPRFIVLKSRQTGMSTWTEAMIFADTANNHFKNSYIIAHELGASSNLFHMSRLYYDCLPDVIRPVVSRSNEKALVFEDKDSENKGLRSKFSVGTANTVEGGRGNTFHNLHVSEVAFFPSADKTLTALLQSVPDMMNTMVVLESTANGIGDYFHKQWNLAKQGSSDFIPIFLPWSIDPTCVRPFRSEEEKDRFVTDVEKTYVNIDGVLVRTYEKTLMEQYNLSYEQLNWRKWAINNKCGGNETVFQQEYPINDIEAFISTGRPAFNIETLREYMKKSKDAEDVGYIDVEGGIFKFRKENKGYIKMWEKPTPGVIYAIGADVAEGLENGDYSSAYVINTKTLDIVANWHGHIDPDLFGTELVKLARYYNNAFLGCENNNHGISTCKAVVALEYWNIYYTKTFDKLTDKFTQRLGWTTNMKSKPLMIDKLAEYIRERHLGLPDAMLIDELMTYVIAANGSTNGQNGCNDDRVISMAITLMMALENMGDEYTPERTDNVRKQKDVIHEEDNKLEVAQ